MKKYSIMVTQPGYNGVTLEIEAETKSAAWLQKPDAIEAWIWVNSPEARKDIDKCDIAILPRFN